MKLNNNNILPLCFLLLGCFASLNAQADTCQQEMPKTDQYSEAILFYPCGLTSKAPSLTLTAGYSNTYRNLQWMTDTLVDEGYIILAMTPADKYGDVYEWKAAHMVGQQTLQNENQRDTSPIHQLVDRENLGMVGFSMGGGGALLAASEMKTSVKAVVAHAPFLLKPERQLIDIKSPTMIIAAAKDLLVTTESVIEIYNQVQRSANDNLLAIYSEGRHVHWYHPKYIEYKPEYAKQTIRWLDLHLKNDLTQIEPLSNLNKTNQHSKYKLKGFSISLSNEW